MSRPILETKLFIPQPKPTLVPRPRLTKQLQAGLTSKLTLIAAPPGFGKTTLVSTSLATCGLPATWLSLEPSDNDPSHFFTYATAALQKAWPHFGTETSHLLPPHATEQITPTALAITFLNNLLTLPAPTILVLDDFHLIDNTELLEAVDFLLEQLPPTLHLLLTTRQEPPLALPRLRVRGELNEIRTADLRFTPSETATFLNQSMSLNLSKASLNILEQRTEGWIAGLQLAALSLRHQTQRDTYIKTFSGKHHFLTDYLIQEVLRTQSAPTRQFLLTTSLLARLNGSLANALTGRADGQETLAQLERANLFLIPLDESRTWYRYHHLFADVLQAQLQKQSPHSVPHLHLKASDWFAQHGFTAEAIHHALHAHQYDRVAALVETSWPTLRQIYNEDTLIAWLTPIPETLLQAHPLLNTHYAFALMSINPDLAKKKLDEVQAWLDAPTTSPQEQQTIYRQSIPGLVALGRAFLAGARKNLPQTIKHTQDALKHLPQDDFFGRGSAGAMLGLTHWAKGDLTTAYAITQQSLTDMRRSQNKSAAISTLFIMADMCMAQLKLRQAEKICRQVMALVADADGRNPQGSANIHVILSEIHYQRGNLAQAHAALQTSRALGEQAGLEVMRHRWYGAMAHLNLAEGDAENAFSNLQEAEAVYFPSPAPEIRSLTAVQSRFWVRQAHWAEVRTHFKAQNLHPNSQITHLNLYEMTTLAHFLLAQPQERQAPLNNLLQTLETTAVSAQRTADLIDILILQTLQTHSPKPLQRALLLALPEKATQRFLNHAPALLPHLRQIQTNDKQLQTFIRHIATHHPPPNTTTPPHTPSQPLIEPLSEREIEVLSLMAAGQTNQQIANQLFLTLNTIKVHARNIYGKLHVHNRTQAINRARQLGFLPNTTFGV